MEPQNEIQEEDNDNNKSNKISKENQDLNNKLNFDNSNNPNYEKTNNNQNQQRKFNVNEILEKCQKLNNYNLINYMCEIMHETKIKFMKVLLINFGKKYLLHFFEKTLNVENSGGLIQAKTEEKKSTGGVFFSLIKEDPEGKKLLKNASKMSKKLSKKNKK